MRAKGAFRWISSAFLALACAGVVDTASAQRGRRGSVRARNRSSVPRYGRDRFYGERERPPDPRETWRPAKVYTHAPGAPTPSPSTGVGQSEYYAPLPNPAEMRRQRAAEKAAEAGIGN